MTWRTIKQRAYGLEVNLIVVVVGLVVEVVGCLDLAHSGQVARHWAALCGEECCALHDNLSTQQESNALKIFVGFFFTLP